MRYKFKSVDYLPWMYMYEFLFASGTPQEIMKYDTLFRPYDKFIWISVIVSIIAIYLTLIFMQMLWGYGSGDTFKGNYLFQGEYTNKFHIPHIC